MAAGQVLGVGHLSAYLRQLLESDDLLSDLWVEGEVSDHFVSKQGHIYFTLCDEQATIRCVMFRGNATRQRQTVRPGDQVAVHGRVSIYEQQGRYQLYVDVVQPAGVGLLALQFELLRQKLEAEGLFDESRKRPLPPAPRVIGVVTSADGAVWHDIQHVLGRRYPLAHLILSPTLVQGARAPQRIVDAIERLTLDARCEVIIIARGGGSAEDLACFNDERVVRAAFGCPAPVISAIGHETDWTLLDLVADLRAPTPSAAAEIVAPSIATYEAGIADAYHRLTDAAWSSLDELQTALDEEADRLRATSPRMAFARVAALAQSLQGRVVAAARTSLVTRGEAVAASRGRLRAGTNATIERRTWDVVARDGELRALDPQSVMARGFALLTVDDGRAVLRSAHDPRARGPIRAQLADGTLDLRAAPAPMTLENHG